MKAWTLFVPGEPKPTRLGSIIVPRHGGRPFIKKRGAEWANRIALAAEAVRPAEFLSGPLSASLRFRMVKPTTGKAKQRAWPTVRPDVDRLVSGLLDALNGIVYADDALVVRLQLEKVYDGTPGVEITVAPIEPAP